jgi:hypothetical protein
MTDSSDSLSQAILNSIQSRIAVVDPDGMIRVVNEAWTRFAIENGDPDLLYTGVGINYLEVTRHSAENGDSGATKVLAGMMQVLQGESDLYEHRYPCHSATEERWYLMRVTPLKASAPRGIVVSHIDITAQHVAARARARRAAREQTTRRQQRALSELQEVAGEADVGIVVDEDLSGQYETLVQQMLEARIFKQSFDRRDEARALANALAIRSAGPREVIALHTAVIERQRASKQSPQRKQALVEEARLLLVEVMGYLAATYRDMIMNELEQRAL